MYVILIIVLVILMFAGLPTWGYHSYGAWPSGLGFILVVVLIILLLTGRL